MTSNSVGGADDFSSTCGGGGFPDDAYRWTAPVAGTYRISVSAPSLDPLLAVYEEDCGDELACVADAGPAEVVLAFEAGQAAVLVVDSNSGAGDYTLEVERLVCGQEDGPLPGATLPATVSGNFDGAVDLHQASCLAGNGVDRSYTFVAPASDVYRFTAESSGGGLLGIALYDGDRCEGAPRSCQAETTLSTGVAVATRYLDAGDEVSVVVENLDAASEFELIVASGPNFCDPPVVEAGNDTTFPTVMVPGGPVIGFGTCGGDPSGGGGHLFRVPSEGSGAFFGVSATGSEDAFVISAWRGDPCGGELVPGTTCTPASGGFANISLTGANAPDGFFVLVEPIGNPIPFGDTVTLEVNVALP